LADDGLGIAVVEVRKGGGCGAVLFLEGGDAAVSEYAHEYEVGDSHGDKEEIWPHVGSGLVNCDLRFKVASINGRVTSIIYWFLAVFPFCTMVITDC
jgi:hypothetical protein